MAEGARLGVVGGGAASAAALTSLGQPLSLATAVLVVSDALRALREAEPERLIIVGVSGLAGAGKSTLASKLCSMFAGSRVVQLRNYYRPRRRAAARGGEGRRALYCDRMSDPASFDLELLCAHLEALRRGEAVADAPAFEYEDGNFATETIAPPESKVLIVEGVCALDAALRPLYSLSCFVVGGVYFELLRRVQGDIGEESFDASDIFPGIRGFVEASWRQAQVRVRNDVDSALAEKSNRMYMIKVPLNGRAPPTADEIATRLEAEQYTYKTSTYHDWFMQAPAGPEALTMKCRLHGGKCFLTPERLWLVDQGGPFIIAPERGEFECETATVSGLKRVGYRIAVSYKQTTNEWSDSTSKSSFFSLFLNRKKCR